MPVMTQAQSIYTLCNYGVVYTRIQSIRKEKERERKREEKRNTLMERESGKEWQNGRSGYDRVVTSPPPRRNACPQA
jgi:hypothetical protein